MVNPRTNNRANRLVSRLWKLTDPALKAAYGDMTGLQVTAGEDNILAVSANFTDGTALDWAFDPTVGAYVMRDTVTADVDKRCAEIRKARSE